jgi:hypothetical protein
MTDHDDHTRIETEVTGEVSAQSWRELLALLESADRFGLVNSSASGLTAWAVIANGTPAKARDASQGSAHQP